MGVPKPIEYIVVGKCHICTSHALDSSGYPQIKRNGKSYIMSRYIYELNFGPIPKGLCVRHKCDTPKCINKKHFILGTHTDNMRDMVKRGRVNNSGRLSGINHKDSLSIKLVAKIKKAKGTYIEIAERFGVGNYVVGVIKRGEHWSQR